MKRNGTWLLLTAMLMALFIACDTDKKQDEEVIPGIVVENMDTSVRPNDDFFRYVNGSWLDKTEIPADRTSWGSFHELIELHMENKLDHLVEQADGS